MGEDDVRIVPPQPTQEQLEQAADQAVEHYAKTNEDRDAVTAANAINKAFRKTGSDDLKRALDRLDPQGGAVVGPATARNQNAKNVVNTYQQERHSASSARRSSGASPSRRSS